MSETVLLLTATISPGCSTNTARYDPQVRLQDYRSALTHWLTHGPCRHVVICESSAAPDTYFSEQAALAKQLGRTLEFYSFQQDFDAILGKGFGELSIIEHALTHSPRLAQAQTILKATGRYIVRNAANLYQQAGTGEADVICDLREYLTVADCRWFAATPQFFRQYLIPRHSDCDDSKNRFLEHILVQATHAALADGLTWRLPQKNPVIVGMGGITNRQMNTSLSKRGRLLAKRLLLRH
jgi:hypothetical protein